MLGLCGLEAGPAAFAECRDESEPLPAVLPKWTQMCFDDVEYAYSYGQDTHAMLVS